MNQTAVHISLPVHDLAVSVRFYEALFGAPPAKTHADYAKFESAAPALALALNPVAGAEARPVAGHLGLRFTSDAELERCSQRLTAAQWPLRREEDVVCCYARASKFWVDDPDGNSWEIYRFIEDAAVHSSAATTACCDTECCP